MMKPSFVSGKRSLPTKPRRKYPWVSLEFRHLRVEAWLRNRLEPKQYSHGCVIVLRLGRLARPRIRASLPLANRELAGNRRGFETEARRHEPKQYSRFSNPSCRSEYAVCGKSEAHPRHPCPMVGRSTQRKIRYVAGGADRRELLMRITLPMNLCKPPSKLLFSGNDGRRDLVASLLEFLPQSSSLGRTAIKLDEMIRVQDQHLSGRLVGLRP